MRAINKTTCHIKIVNFKEFPVKSEVYEFFNILCTKFRIKINSKTTVWPTVATKTQNSKSKVDI